MKLDEHVHSPSKVYPTLAAGVTVTGNAGAWVLGVFAEIVPATTITKEFDIHHICLEDISANGVYEIVLYQGATDIEVGRVRVVQDGVFSGVLNIPFQTALLPANARIRAKVASSSGGGDTVTISIFYHTYD